ncbi:MAG: hypothetical protein K2L70_04680 [Clostridia bacterium]|nr:hypothetical protein [Clostridia bacterium]
MNIEIQEFEKVIRRTRGTKRQELRQILDHCNEVEKNISIVEMDLIWYIRHSKKYRAHSYLIIAKKIYEAEFALRELLDVPNNIEVDKK